MWTWDEGALGVCILSHWLIVCLTNWLSAWTQVRVFHNFVLSKEVAGQAHTVKGVPPCPPNIASARNGRYHALSLSRRMHHMQQGTASHPLRSLTWVRAVCVVEAVVLLLLLTRDLLRCCAATCMQV